MTPEELNNARQSANPPSIIDVRTSFEHKSGCVPSAVNIPFFLAPVKAFLLKNEKDKELIIYCEHGPRAYIASLFFLFAGYKKIKFLSGHMHGWRKRDLPME